MELSNSSYLLTLATLSITFVGFTAIVVILRQSLGSAFLAIDALVARLFMVWGFTITYASLLPVVLAAYDFSASVNWRVSSIVSGIFLIVINFGYPLLRIKATGERTPLHVWLHVSVGIIIALFLLLNAVDRFPGAAPAIYATALTLYLIQASFAFVQHFGFMLEGMSSKAKRRK
jgi:hypothetical protein